MQSLLKQATHTTAAQMHALSRAKHVSSVPFGGGVQAAVLKTVRGCVRANPSCDSSSPRTTDTSFQLAQASSHTISSLGRREYHFSTLKSPVCLSGKSFGAAQSKLSSRSTSGSLAFSTLGFSYSSPLRAALSRHTPLGLRAFHATNVAQKKRDPYEVLEVPRGATQKDIKKAYFAKAKKYHPDVNTEDPKAKDKFAEINSAYEILGDAEKRKMYDQGMMDQDGNEAGFGGGFGGFQGGFQGAPDDIFEELANMFGGGRQGGSRRGAGKDINLSVTISFMEAAKGCTKSVSYEVKDSCVTCDGSGAQPGSQPRTCGTCRGTGETVNRAMGVFQMHSTCRVCRGQGKVIDRPCTTCKGEGRVGSTKTTEVQIPAGMSEEVRLRIANQGEPGMKGAGAGHLYVQVQIQPHPRFQRNGYDVHVTVPITISQAMMGARIQVPGIDGDQTVAISPGTQPGSHKVLRNHGIRHLNNSQQYGDLIIHFKVEIPRKLTDKQRELMEEFAKTETFQQS